MAKTGTNTVTTTMATTTGTTRGDHTGAQAMVAEAETALAGAQQEVARLRALVSGETRRWETRTARHVYPDRNGQRAERDVTETVLVVDVVDPLARLRAKQALPEAEARLIEAEVALTVARRAAAEAHRAHRTIAIQRGDDALRRLVPDLVDQVRAFQETLRRFHAALADLDADVGEAYYNQTLAHPVLVDLVGAWAETVARRG
jgi:hypothetical protein